MSILREAVSRSPSALADIAYLLTALSVEGQICITMQNFIEICQPVGEI